MTPPKFTVKYLYSLAALLLASSFGIGPVGVRATAASGLTPVLECVIDDGYGAFTAYFGYNNEGGAEVTVPVGYKNQFSPDPADRGQTTTFKKGRHFNVFKVSFTGSGVTWKLDGKSAAASSSSPICKKADMSLTKKVDNATPWAGDAVTFTLTALNSGPNSGLDIEVTDLLPAGLVFEWSKPSQGTYDNKTGIWNVGALAPHTSAKLEIRAKVTATTAVTNTAEVTKMSRLDIDSKPGNNDPAEDDQDSVTVTPRQKTGGDKDDDVCYVVADDESAGGDNSSGMKDVFVRINANTGAEVRIGQTGTLDIETMAYDNKSGVLYAVDGGQLGTIHLGTGAFTKRPHSFGSGKGSAGTITFDDVDGLAFDPTTGNLFGSVRRVGKADLLIRIDPSTGKAVAGAFGYNVDYVAIAPVKSNLTDIDDLAFDAYGQLYGTANNDGQEDRLAKIDKATGATEDKGRIRNASGTGLDNFEAFTSRPDGGLVGIRGGNFKEIYRIDAATAVGTHLSTLSKASDYEAITCNIRQAGEEMADLELTKTVDDKKPYTGGNVTFTLTLTNKGPNVATWVEVRDKLPYALIYAQHNASQGTFDPATGLWKVGRLGVWETATIKIIAQVRAGSYDPITNTAEVVHSDQKDPDSTPNNNKPAEDDQGSVTLTPRPHDANLCIQKWVDNPAPKKGDEVTFFIKVCNDPADFRDIVVEDRLPDGLWFIKAEADKGYASYDDHTRKVTWKIPLLPFGETTTLKVRALVDTHNSVENCARIVASTPPDNPGDNKSCAAVTPGQSSGGGDAGVESEGNLATKLAQRLFLRRQDAQVREALHAAPAPVPFVQGQSVSMAAGKTGTATNMGAFIPSTGPQNTSAFVVTPTDLLGITNATSVFAADYVRPEGRRLAALFGATSPAGVLYDHAKATCDRLGGGRLEAVRTLDVKGYPFVLSRLVHPNGATDYSVSFVAYETSAGLIVDSRFSPGEYDVPAGAQEVINLQVWSVAPEYTAELVGEMLDLMSAQRGVIYLNTETSAPAIPAVFVLDGAYAQGQLSLRLVNRSGSRGSVIVRGTAARTELEAERGTRTPFEYTVALPETDDEAIPVSITVEVGAVFDATFEVEHVESGTRDALYYADGAWSYTTGNATVSTFATTAHAGASVEPGRYLIERSARLGGQVTDWASLFRYFRPGGQPVDLAKYEYVEFFAKGTGKAHFVLEKASIQTWDQYTYAFQLRPEGHLYRVYLDEFTRSGGLRGLTAEDLTLAAFYVLGNGQTTPFELEVRDFAFGGASASVANDRTPELPQSITLGQNYPNPFNPTTRIEFELTETMPARLAVYDMLGRELAVLADATMPAGRHAVAFEAAGLPSGAYLYRLVTPHRTLTGKMVLMK